MPFYHVPDESARKEEALGTETQKGAESERDYLGTLQTGPKLVKLNQYPFTQFGTQQRDFNKNGLDTFQWIEYSVSKNSAFLVVSLGRIIFETAKTH